VNTKLSIRIDGKAGDIITQQITLQDPGVTYNIVVDTNALRYFILSEVSGLIRAAFRFSPVRKTAIVNNCGIQPNCTYCQIYGCGWCEGGETCLPLTINNSVPPLFTCLSSQWYLPTDQCPSECSFVTRSFISTGISRGQLIGAAVGGVFGGIFLGLLIMAILIFVLTLRREPSEPTKNHYELL